jgi:hypothetical protein
LIDTLRRPSPGKINNYPDQATLRKTGVSRIIAQQHSEMLAAEARGPEEAARLQAQHDLKNSQLLSDLSSMRSGAMMAVAYNLRA